MSWNNYYRTGLSEMRPYVPGEDLTAISVSQEDTPEEGGMIARNPANYADQWYVAKAYFERNFTLDQRGNSGRGNMGRAGLSKA